VAALALASLALLPALAGLAVRAIPRLDLSGYPKPAAGDRRWVIQLPGVLRPSADPALSANPRDWRVQLLVGQTARVDCNQHSFSARLQAQRLPDGRGVLYRVREVGPLSSTRMACPGRPPETRFIPMAGKPFVLPYNASVPIVLDAPAPLELRWRLWKAEAQSQPAQQVP
jgi:ecotin